MSYVAFKIIFCIIPILFFYLICIRTKHDKDLYKKLPREKIVGSIIIAGSLIWSTSLIYPMLEGGFAMLKPIVLVAVPILPIAIYFYSDYILTRALGGIIMLSGNFMVYQALHHNMTPGFRSLFSLACYTIFFLSAIMVAMPWRFRDLLQKVTICKKTMLTSKITLSTIATILIIAIFL